MRLNKCPILGSKKSTEYLNLGDVPIVNNLCNTKKESLTCEKFPLSIQFFHESSLTSLTETINSDKLFLNYFYRSSINKPYLQHCGEMYEYLINYLDLKKGDLVVDIGGNDGSLLLEFRNKNPYLQYVNIDCSKTFIEINKAHKIEYINEYFSEKTKLSQKIKLIISTNVFQHTEQIRSFVKGINYNLSDDGIWCLEFPYILTTLINDNFDQIYHEHIYYYSLKNIFELFDQEDLKIINVSYHNIHTGTLRVLSTKKSSKRKADSTIASFLNLEKNIITLKYCQNWGRKISNKIKESKNFILNLVKNGNVIAGFGAAAKGCIFLNTCGIDNSSICFIVDDTVSKQGKFVPGTGIEIVNRDKLNLHAVDYIIILAHNFKDYIIESLKDQYKGKFIVMFPEIQII